MRIAGFVKQSLVDYPGKIAAAIFTQGCNMDCVFCHNRCLVGKGEAQSFLDEEDIFPFLEKRRKFLEGVVVSGGEPTLQPDLEDFLQRVKNMGYLVKLDTNGTRPKVIKKLYEKNLLDYVAMDVKAPMKKYREICRVDVDEESLLKSMSVIRESNVDYEFRTTCCPQLNESDIEQIGELVCGAKKYVLQQYRETDEIAGGYTGIAEPVQFRTDPIKELRNVVAAFQVRGDIEIHAV